jgi:hypothetical protein
MVSSQKKPVVEASSASAMPSRRTKTSASERLAVSPKADDLSPEARDDEPEQDQERERATAGEGGRERRLNERSSPWL